MEEAQVAQEVQEDQEYQEEAEVLEALVVPHMEEESWGVTHRQNLMVIAPKRTPLL